jgi:hypothetical protein
VRLRAASCTYLMTPSVFGLFEFTITLACGTSSDSSLSRLGVNSSMRKLTPVRLPPGRARLATRPAATGSPPIMETIGIVEVALFAASDERSPPLAAIPSTLRPTGSAANAGRRSWRFSAQRKDRYVILSDRLPRVVEGGAPSGLAVSRAEPGQPAHGTAAEPACYAAAQMGEIDKRVSLHPLRHERRNSVARAASKGRLK